VLIQICRAKIHRARVTDANLDYEGSISIAKDLLAASTIKVYERVQVVNLNNGARFETYAIEGKEGEICLNGAAARLGQIGDLVILIAYALVDFEASAEFKPIIVQVDSKNRQVN